MCVQSKINDLSNKYGQKEVEKALDLAEEILNKNKKKSLVEKIASKLYFLFKGTNETTHSLIECNLDKARKELQDHLAEYNRDKNSLRELAGVMVGNEEKRIMSYYINESSPVMSWAKRLDGTYIDLNKATAKLLFNTEDINSIIGKNDIEIATELRKKFPDRTFGEICKGTDDITIEKNRPMKFFEWGVIYDRFEYLVVYKSPIYDHNGKMIGTTGSAIVATDEVSELLNIMNDADDSTKTKIEKYLRKYGFGCDNKFTEENIFEYNT